LLVHFLFGLLVVNVVVVTTECTCFSNFFHKYFVVISSITNAQELASKCLSPFVKIVLKFL
jgi:hypothetical protein